MNELSEILNVSVNSGKLLESAKKNIESLLAGAASDLPKQTVSELLSAENYSELNDRFFKTLAFGTGGLRGRTIGRTITASEQGGGGPNGRPEFPCVGTATMNYYNVSRAIRGLITYMKSVGTKSGGKVTFVFAHDTRHFSKDFADFCAKVCAEHGCDAYVFDGPRSTPQLSFAIRQLRADSGVVITASHNPSHDCGFKAYFNDGAQIVEPHATAIIGEVNAVTSERYEPLPIGEQGTIKTLGKDFDEVYISRLKTLLLQPELLKTATTKIVFTNLHGTGGHINVPMLHDLGFEVLTVPERMGVAARDDQGKMVLLTGNQIGSLMAWYRLKIMFELGWISHSNRTRAVLVKTFVTTELQTAIADSFGVSVVDTLTGFKYISAKLKKYEDAIPVGKKGDYRSLTEDQTRALRLEYSRFFVFGGEESYGYLGSDSVRDKDANGATLMFAEVAAYAKSVGKTLPRLLDELYEQFGYFLEVGKSLTMEGADGAAKIQALANSYAKHPPQVIDGFEVTRFRDFSAQDIYDQEGDLLPKEKMLFFDLADGRSFAVRPSGTEPKIKYYLYGKSKVSGDLAATKQQVANAIEALWKWIENDAKSRG
jgi:phosphoglucomutase